MTRLSDRISKMQHSPIRKFNEYALKAEEAGKTVYRLNIGQPDIETPECFLTAIREFDDKVVSYAESRGIEELLDSIIYYFKEHFDIDYEKENLLVTTGGSEALSMLFLTILNDDEEVLVADPFYTNYYNFIGLAGGKIKPIPTTAEEGYKYADYDRIEACITDKTRAICCTNPGNPTGTLLSAEEMKVICEIAKKYDLWIIADEVYREFVYDGKNAISFATFEDISDRLVIIDSVSKRFSACGARVGFIATKNRELYDNVMKIAQGRLCTATIDQVGAAAMYRMDESYYEEVRAEYESRRDAVYEELMKIPGAFCRKPGAGFYITVQLPVEDTEDFLIYLLTEFEDNGETVMFAPSKGFYATPGKGQNEIRIAYVLSREKLIRGVELIRIALEKYNSRSE